MELLRAAFHCSRTVPTGMGSTKCLLCFETWSHVAEAGFEFLMLLRAGVIGAPYTGLTEHIS